MKHKCLTAFFLAISLVFFGARTVQAGGNADKSGQADKPLNEVAARLKWAEDNGLNKTETVQELYEKAKLEGEVNIYGNTGRYETVAAEFMKAYPGVKVTFYDLGTNEILEKFSREYKAGIYTADVIGITEVTGSVYHEYIKTGLFHNYQPADIFNNVIDKSWLKFTPFVIEIDWWYYNTEINSDLPINSWWDLTKPEWKGRFIFEDPARVAGTIAAFIVMTKYNDELAKDYERVFGTPLKLENDEPSVAYALIKRMAKNGPVLEPSLTNIVKSVGGAAGIRNPPIGFGSSAKLRERDIQGWRLGANPSKIKFPASLPAYAIIQVADKAPHPNAAKLFSRFVCGEAGHKGKGLETFLTAGSYPVFSDVEIKVPQPGFGSVSLFTDIDYLYENFQDIYDYWISVQP
jgi:iron(III) transport system substrate-binding protein